MIDAPPVLSATPVDLRNPLFVRIVRISNRMTQKPEGFFQGAMR